MSFASLSPPTRPPITLFISRGPRRNIRDPPTVPFSKQPLWMLTTILGSLFLTVVPILAAYAGTKYTASEPPTPADAPRDPNSYFKTTIQRSTTSHKHPSQSSKDQTPDPPPSPRDRPASLEKEALHRSSIIHQASPARKPWNPPFPTSTAANTPERRQSPAVLPASHPQPQHQPRCPTPLSPPSQLRLAGTIDATSDTSSHHTPSPSSIHAQAPRRASLASNIPAAEIQYRPSKPETVRVRTLAQRVISALKASALVLGILLFIFGFAVLTAHCLAWFIVYKTEARLGEVRRGVVRGGEMRVCLCARG
ncbi:hypothetical protein EJ04DRAFT_581182 [Polyplosphaeria fusca]|uniref:Transmembrane protein n=1 Tax=Polyplosphaeria fusca TaxID=682080 RepID=A0A9P4QJW3_9PLEO|nr:hypothetical protein EJ04DRAFT_581182 [Polyplosphaeria fusca]